MARRGDMECSYDDPSATLCLTASTVSRPRIRRAHSLLADALLY